MSKQSFIVIYTLFTLTLLSLVYANPLPVHGVALVHRAAASAAAPPAPIEPEDPPTSGTPSSPPASASVPSSQSAPPPTTASQQSQSSASPTSSPSSTASSTPTSSKQSSSSTQVKTTSSSFSSSQSSSSSVAETQSTASSTAAATSTQDTSAAPSTSTSSSIVSAVSTPTATDSSTDSTSLTDIPNRTSLTVSQAFPTQANPSSSSSFSFTPIVGATAIGDASSSPKTGFLHNTGAVVATFIFVGLAVTGILIIAVRFFLRRKRAAARAADSDYFGDEYKKFSSYGAPQGRSHGSVYKPYQPTVTVTPPADTSADSAYPPIAEKNYYGTDSPTFDHAYPPNVSGQDQQYDQGSSSNYGQQYVIEHPYANEETAPVSQNTRVHPLAQSTVYGIAE